MAEVPAQVVLNEAALKRFDPYVKEILDTAKHVALYLFNTEESEWEKTNVEGSLFVYSRTGEPYHNILVLNRLSTTNLIEPITSELQLQLQEPFLLYRNNECRIYGIWFYVKEECARLAGLIQQLMEKSVGNDTANVKLTGRSNIDLFSMLSKAQEVFKTSKSTTKQTDATPQSVMEFFAKAGGAPTKAVVTPSRGKVILGRPASVNAPDPGEVLNPLLHKLMSNPVHSVEHIEKQQRSVTPLTDSSQVRKSFVRPFSSENITDIGLENSSKPQSSKAENGVNGFNFLRIPSPCQTQLLFTNSLLDSDLPSGISQSSLETPQKPALMPPAMFTPSHIKEEISYSSLPNTIEPLTKNQLLQAMNYLLKNDTEFVSKIHEAYVKSLNDKVS